MTGPSRSVRRARWASSRSSWTGSRSTRRRSRPGGRARRRRASSTPTSSSGPSSTTRRAPSTPPCSFAPSSAATLEGVEHIHIDTFDAAYQIIAKDPEKWDPKTRETADHSLQYIVVAALEDGEVTQDTFDARADPAAGDAAPPPARGLPRRGPRAVGRLPRRHPEPDRRHARRRHAARARGPLPARAREEPHDRRRGDGEVPCERGRTVERREGGACGRPRVVARRRRIGRRARRGDGSGLTWCGSRPRPSEHPARRLRAMLSEPRRAHRARRVQRAVGAAGATRRRDRRVPVGRGAQRVDGHARHRARDARRARAHHAPDRPRDRTAARSSTPTRGSARR